MSAKFFTTCLSKYVSERIFLTKIKKIRNKKKIQLTFFKQQKNIEQSFKITFPHSLTFEWKIL